MTFRTSAGSTSSITLPQPKEDVATADIQAAMELVIAKNIFTTAGGDLAAIRDMKVIDTTVEDLYEATV